MSARWIRVASAALIPIGGAERAKAQCAVNLANFTGTYGIQTINYIPVGNEPFANTLESIDKWAFGCLQGGVATGSDCPSLNVPSSTDSSPNTLNVYVNYNPGMPFGGTGTCGYTLTTVDSTTGQITGATIEMFQYDIHGNPCEPAMVQLVAHEIGHTLGLDDVGNNPSCNGSMMGNPPADHTQWNVDSGDCQKVAVDWTTYQEIHVNDACNQQCQGTCDNGQCTEGQPSPILIDVGGHGYHLTSATEGTHFDIDADGYAEQTGWTRNGENAFLCLDLNRNGIIDDARELFGNHTLLSSGAEALNGYVAVAEYDRTDMGGNGNGQIDPGDVVWPYLQLWADRDHDGISQPQELEHLDAAGVLAIDNRYYLARRRDEYGNLFRYRGRCVMRGANGIAHERMTYDVFFVTSP